MSGGQLVSVPVHDSARSHAPAAARHTVPASAKAHEEVQQVLAAPFEVPRSHCSPSSTPPSPQDDRSTGADIPRPPAGTTRPPGAGAATWANAEAHRHRAVKTRIRVLAEEEFMG